MELKVIQSAKNDYPILGFNFNQMDQKNSFNDQNLQAFFALGLAIISNFVYFFHVAQTIDEFIISTFMTTSIVVATIVYVTLLWKMNTMRMLCNAIEKLINESEFEFPFFCHFESQNITLKNSIL